MAPEPFDIDYPRGLLVVLTVTTLIVLVIAASTSSSAFGVYNTRWDGVADLRAQADAVGTETDVIRNTSAYQTASPPQSIAVVLSPTTGYSSREIGRLREFVVAGGTLVIAEDFGQHTNPLLGSLGVSARIDGRLLRDERYNYRSPAMPIARNVTDVAITQGVSELTINHGTAIMPGDATTLISTSEYAYLDDNRNGQLDENESLESYPVVVVESLGDGRVVVLGDPSALINVMLDRSGNQVFVQNLFRSHERVLLDYSHAGRLPPVMVALLTIRQSPSLQILIGILGISLIGLWSRNDYEPILERYRQYRNQRQPSRITVTAEEVQTYIEQRHPEWDSERVQRVIQGIIKQQTQDTDDD